MDRGLLEPVGSVPGTGLDLRVLLGDEGRPVVLGCALDLVGQVVDLHVLLGVQRGDTVGVRVLPAVVSVEAHLDLAGLAALLGGHEDDAVGSPGTVDGAGGGVLQDVDGLDVVGGEGGDGAVGHTVDDVERGVGTGGTHTADRHFVALARLTGVLDDIHAGGLALQGAEGIDGVRGGEFVAAHAHRGTGHEFLALHTVTDDDGFFKHLGVVLEGDGHVVGGSHPAGGVADAGNLQRCPGGHVDGEVAVEVGGDTVRGARHQNAGADDRRAVCVDDFTKNGRALGKGTQASP